MSAVREPPLLLLPLALLALQASPEVKVENSTRSLVESDAEASVETARCSVRKKHLELQVCNSRPMRTSLCHGACVEVDSDTEAVANRGFKLGCISCKMRGEVRAVASVNWYFKASDETEFLHIYSYKDNMEEKMEENITDERFSGRLEWAGSKQTKDLQDGSIYIRNVTFNDTGVYNCTFNRTLMYSNYEFTTNTSKTVVIKVVPRLTRGIASILSEVMMYVSIIGLQLWLVVEMIYCYRKIAAAGEEALRESAAEYLAIASESKDNCASEQVAE